MSATVEIKGVNFGYVADKPILKNISLKIEKGETVAIIGLSGSGKSTLLRLIADLITPTPKNTYSGDIKINGVSPKEFRKRRKTSIMFQSPALFPDRSVKANVKIPLQISGSPVVESDVDELIRIVGLAKERDSLPDTLSGGMQTRVELARAFISKPDLLLLDEPFSALDISWSMSLYQELEKIKERFETTIIFVTHDIQEALLLSNNIFVLGKTGTPLEYVKIPFPLPRVFNFNESIKKIQKYVVRLQNLVLIDGIGKISSDEELPFLISTIEETQFDGNGLSDEIKLAIRKIRKFSDNETVNFVLWKIWGKGNYEIRRELIWGILNFHGLSIDKHKVLFQFVLSNLNDFSRDSWEWYGVDRSQLLDSLIQRIKDPNFPKSKKWIYLTLLKEVPNKMKLNTLLSSIIDESPNISDNFQYPFAKEVALVIHEEINK